MNQGKKILLYLVLFCLCSQTISADLHSTTDSARLKIGVIYNLNGSQAALDIPSSQGALTAESIINKNGGIDGVLVEVIMRDGGSDPETIARQAEDLIVNMSVPVVIGLSDTDMVLPAAKVAVTHHVPFITSGASSPKLPEQVPEYLYLACFSDNAQAALSAEYAYENLSYNSVSVLYDVDMEYTVLLAQYFTKRFKELGGEIIATIPLNTTTDLSHLPAILHSANQPDFYYIALGPEDAPVAVRAVVHSGENTTPVFGGDSYDTKNLTDAVLDTRGGVYYTTHAWFGGNNLSPEVEEFIKEYKMEYGTDPTPFAGLGYDTVMIVAKAAGYMQPGTDIREGINKIKEFRGVTGIISYENGSVIPKKSVHLIFSDGQNLTQAEDGVPEKVPNP